MTRLNPVNRSTADAKTTQMLDGVEKKLGILPNMISTMAQSNAAANAYLGASNALAGGLLPATVREQIALTVGEANNCSYCVAAHSAIGVRAGLDKQALIDSRMARDGDQKINAILQFTKQVVESRGEVSDSDVAQLKDHGVSQGEIAEVIAHVALNIYTNYFNKVAATEIDFPAPVELPEGAACGTCS